MLVQLNVVSVTAGLQGAEVLRQLCGPIASQGSLWLSERLLTDVVGPLY
jgi:hypothetical protein